MQLNVTDSQALMMAKYMEEHLGELFEGIVVNNDGQSVKVRTNNFIYGKIDLQNCNNQILKSLKIGTKVLLKVENVSMLDKSIYFSYVKNIENMQISEKQKVLSLNKKI